MRMHTWEANLTYNKLNAALLVSKLNPTPGQGSKPPSGQTVLYKHTQKTCKWPVYHKTHSFIHVTHGDTCSAPALCILHTCRIQNTTPRCGCMLQPTKLDRRNHTSALSTQHLSTRHPHAFPAGALSCSSQQHPGRHKQSVPPPWARTRASHSAHTLTGLLRVLMHTLRGQNPVP
jgi:hypothetical protein